MAHKLTSVVVTSGGAKSAFINTRDLVERGIRSKPLPVFSVKAPALDTNSAALRWYASLTGEADSEFTLTDDAGNNLISKVTPGCGVEVDQTRGLRWRYLMFEVCQADGTTAVNQSANRTFTIAAESL